MADNLAIPYGISDFCLFPKRHRFGGVKHSYLVELKYSAADAPGSERAAKYGGSVNSQRQTPGGKT